IRVLDATTYDEVLTINDRTRHAGIRLEAPKRATLNLPGTANRDIALIIMNVAHVAVHGFRVRLERAGIAVIIAGASAGVSVEELEFRTNQPITTAVDMENLNLADDEDPVTIKNCSIEGFGTGIQVLARNLQSGQAQLCRRIRVLKNKIANVQKGIVLTGL